MNKVLEKRAAELEASNTDLERFAYIASHDLQEPLRMVSSFLHLLEKRLGEQLDDTSKQYIHFAVNGALRMKALIHDLLLYARVDNKQQNFAETDINEIIRYTLQLLKKEIKKINAELIIGEMPHIKADKILFRQLFVNLVSNALKYHSEAPKIEIMHSEDLDNHIFLVKDNGIGIDPRFFDKIFIIFQRLHNKNEFSGSGIGLAICKKIVEIHKGKIWVESALGKGSSFYFSIPKEIL